ncbi:MAG TPA: sulfatase [Pontiella sp.]
MNIKCSSKMIATVASAVLAGTVFGGLPKKPNVVFFLVDDFSAGALSSGGSKLHETPHIDKLFEAGMTFENGYSACTVCSPSRAAILTGKYPARTRLTDWIAGHKKPFEKLKVPNWNMKVEHSEITLAEAMRENGYRTGFFGKWHLMPENQPKLMDEHYPTDHGFDINVGGREWGMPKGRGKYFYPFDMPGLEEGREGEYLTDRLTDEAVRFIDESGVNPFFLYFSYYTVHTPIQARKEKIEKYKKKLESGSYLQKNPKYAAMVEHLDDSVGRVVEELKTRGLWENTIVIFTADNGANYQEYTAGLRKFKGFSYQGGVCEPYLICGPGIEAGSRSDVPVIGMDFYPTILELCGLDAKPEQHVDGVSLAPLLKNKGSIPERNLYWHYPHYHRTKPYSAVISKGWKLIEFHEEGRQELYHLEQDPAESRNVVGSHPEKVAELTQMLCSWKEAVDAQMPTPNPRYDRAKTKHVNM